MSRLLKFLKSVFSLSDENSKNKITYKNTKTLDYESTKVSNTLELNKKYMNYIFSNCSDLIIREVKITNNPQFGAMLVYINNMTKTGLIEETVIQKLTQKNEVYAYYPGSKQYSQYLLGIRDEDIYADIKKAVESILSGKLVLFIDGINEALMININNPPGRSVEEPQVESVVRGPREGFTESITTNLVLTRKKIKSTNFKMESFVIGRETKTDVVIAYILNIANEKIVNEVRERLNKIDIDSVLSANYIKEYIDDEPLSVFPTINSTEKPDVVAGKLLEGRVAIFIDGTPLVITVPAIFFEFLITNEDYNYKFIPATINRWIRYICFFISLTLPGVYLSITTFHQELIPTPLLITFMKARSGLPYPAIVECFIMLFSFEILREAGVRMPKAVGQSISVVGAVVLGQAAVEAGIVSTPMVLLVAITSISSFAIPSTDMTAALTLPRLILLLLGSISGLVGVASGIVIICIRIISIRSFGVPYMGPVVPVISNEITDVFARRPLWTKFRRNWLIIGKHSTRRKQESRSKSIKEEQKKAMEEKKK